MAYNNQELDPHNGDFITNPGFKKTSMAFKCDEMLSDTEVSEDYDNDMFFEGKQP